MTTSLEWPVDGDALVAAARAVRKKAYAPYSGFNVGAAIRVAGGDIFVGCNVENASYGLTICAERTAMVEAVAAGQRNPEVICVSLTGVPVPCGSCRQFLYEFNPQLILLLDNVDSANRPEVVSLRELLPRGFELTS